MNDDEARDAELRKRTDELLLMAAEVSVQLRIQTEKLAAAIENFDRDILAPLREGMHDRDER